MALNLSLKILLQKICFLPRFDFLRFLLFSGALGVIPRLKITFRFVRELYTPSKLMILPLRSKPTRLSIDFKLDIAGARRIVSFLFPGDVTKGAMTLQFLSQNATCRKTLVFRIVVFYRKNYEIYKILISHQYKLFFCHSCFTVVIHEYNNSIIFV